MVSALRSGALGCSAAVTTASKVPVPSVSSMGSSITFDSSSSRMSSPLTPSAPFYDSDTEIERRTGVDIPFIFEKEGERGFRQRERETIEVLTGMEPIVLATGRRAVLLAENRRHLAERGCVVYLETSIAQQVERVRSGRPPAVEQRGSVEKLEG